MRQWLGIGTVLIGALTAAVVVAGIPLPDTVLYGRVFLDLHMQHPADDVSILARVDGVAEPVGRCGLGDRSNAGDHYVLHLRLESLEDGSSQSRDAALVGQTAHLYVLKGAEPEQHLTDYVIPLQGHVEYLDLGERTLGDWTGDALVALDDYPDFAECMKGAAVEATPACAAAFDFNDDLHVDLSDVRAFQMAFGVK